MKRLLLIASLGLSLVVACPAYAQTNLCTAQGAGTAAYNIYSTCYAVTNNTGQTICVFTGSSGEWSTFVNGPWSNVSVAGCAPCAASGACAAAASGTVCTTYTQLTDCDNSCNLDTTTATCINGTWVGTISSHKTCTNTCFTSETLVTMADGTKKRIEDLQIGDAVRGRHGINHVMRTTSHRTAETLYGFNGGKAFVTGGHPFWTKDGWKAVDPALTPKERHNVKTTKLNIGDVLFLDTGEKLTIESIDADDSGGEQTVYSPVMDGDHTYYANGFLVHNKQLC